MSRHGNPAHILYDRQLWHSTFDIASLRDLMSMHPSEEMFDVSAQASDWHQKAIGAACYCFLHLRHRNYCHQCISLRMLRTPYTLAVQNMGRKPVTFSHTAVNTRKLSRVGVWTHFIASKTQCRRSASHRSPTLSVHRRKAQDAKPTGAALKACLGTTHASTTHCSQS